PANLRRYIPEGPDLEIAPLPSIFFGIIRKLVHQADVVVLVEGSAYMDTWTSALLWYFLWATHCADVMGKPCLAYAVDAGGLSPWNRSLVRKVASSTDLIVTRSAAAADRLRSWGVIAPLTSTADNALTFAPSPADAGWLKRDWQDAVDAPVGLAPVDFFRFPVVIRPWGRREYRYHDPRPSSPALIGTNALVGSPFPPTAPMVMIVRIAHGAVPWWQIVLSVGLMVATIYGIVQAAGRIYAGGVLRFGGRVRFEGGLARRRGVTFSGSRPGSRNERDHRP
ncbi:MAG: hypothetical protein ACRDG9_11565, partial [Actinomycetota bacterium]